MKLNRRTFMQAVGFVAAAGGQELVEGHLDVDKYAVNEGKPPKIINYSSPVELAKDPRAVYIHPGNIVRSSKSILNSGMGSRAKQGRKYCFSLEFC